MKMRVKLVGYIKYTIRLSSNLKGAVKTTRAKYIVHKPKEK